MLSDNLPLTPRQRRCLDAIENGSDLREAMYPPPLEAPAQFDNLAKVTVFEIRKIMLAHGVQREIETVWRRGYRLTP